MDNTTATETLPYTDVNQLQQAISSLEASTHAIEAQIKSLQSSQIFLDRNRQSLNENAHVEGLARGQKELQRQGLKSLNDELAVVLKDTLSKSRSASVDAAKTTTNATKQYLQYNAELLTRLQGQSIGLFNSDRESFHSETSRAEDLLLALQRTLAKRQQLKLDGIYLQHTINGLHVSQDQTSSAPQKTYTTVEAQVDQIRNDLNLLFAELDDMSCMIVNHDHGDETRAVNEAISHVSSALERVRTQQLLQRLDRILEDTEHNANASRLLHSHRIFLEQVAVLAPTSATPRNVTDAAGVTHSSNIRISSHETALASLLRHLSLDPAHVPESEPLGKSGAWEYLRLARDASTTTIAQSRSLRSAREAENGIRSKSTSSGLLVEDFESSVSRAQHILEKRRE